MKHFNETAESVQQIPRPDNASYLSSVNRISVLFALVLGAAMWWDRNSAITAVITAGLTYGSVVVLLILFQPSAIPFIAVSFMREITIRRRDKMEFKALDAQQQAQQVAVIDPPRIAYTESAPMQLPDAPRFVPAVAPVEENTRFMAAGFVNELFDLATGQFNLKRVTPNAKQIQRKPPSKDVEKYLEQLGIIVRGKGGQWYWDEARFPTRMEAVNTIRRGRPASLQERGEGRQGRVESGVAQ